MKHLQKNNPTIGAQSDFQLADQAGEDIYIYDKYVLFYTLIYPFTVHIFSGDETHNINDSSVVQDNTNKSEGFEIGDGLKLKLDNFVLIPTIEYSSANHRSHFVYALEEEDPSLNGQEFPYTNSTRLSMINSDGHEQILCIGDQVINQFYLRDNHDNRKGNVYRVDPSQFSVDPYLDHRKNYFYPRFSVTLIR